MKAAVDALITANETIERRSDRLERDLNATLERIGELGGDLEALKRETLTDALSGLANRRRFDEALPALVRGARKSGRMLALVMVDIDHFKTFNDTWGHQVGDQVIRFVSNVLTAEAAANYVVARYGGEEFAVLIPDTTRAEVGSYAEAVRIGVSAKRLTRRSTKQDMGMATVSVGVATLHTGEETAALVKRADINLYASKQAGRNRVTLESAT